jgi:hypothetical protein
MGGEVMKLKVLQTSESKVRRPKKPVDHIKKCPACGDKDLIVLDPDVLCSKCSWDSTFWHVAAGGMDNLEVAAREFEAGARRSKLKTIKPESEPRPETKTDQFNQKIGKEMP